MKAGYRPQPSQTVAHRVVVRSASIPLVAVIVLLAACTPNTPVPSPTPAPATMTSDVLSDVPSDAAVPPLEEEDPLGPPCLLEDPIRVLVVDGPADAAESDPTSDAGVADSDQDRLPIHRVYGDVLRGAELAVRQINDFQYVGPSVTLALTPLTRAALDPLNAVEAPPDDPPDAASGTVAVIGPVSGADILSVISATAGSDLPIIATSSADPGPAADAGRLFHMAPGETALAQATLALLAARRPEARLALIYPEGDPEAGDAAAAMRLEAATLDQVIVVDVAVPIDTAASTADSAQAEGIEDRLTGSAVDAVLLAASVNTADALATWARSVLPDARLIGSDAYRMVSPDAGWPEGLLSAGWWHDDRTGAEAEYLRTDWRDAYGDDPSGSGVRGYVTALAVGAAVRRACSTAPDAILAALAQMRGIPSPIGPISFGPNGAMEAPLTPLEWSEGSWTAIAP